jgi:hypothetical protein
MVRGFSPPARCAVLTNQGPEVVDRALHEGGTLGE